MNKKNIFSFTSVILLISYIVLIIFFAYNFLSLADSYNGAEKKYISQAEQRLVEAFSLDESQIVDALNQVIEDYPMELVIVNNKEVFYQTLPYTVGTNLLGSLNRDVLLAEAEGSYPVGGSDMLVWYSIYQMSDQTYLQQFLSQQLLVVVLAFVVLSIFTFIMQQTLLAPLRKIKTSISKVDRYEFDGIDEATDEVNKSFGKFAHKIENVIHAVSRKHTQLETELQMERERLNNTIMVSRSLVHDFKSPIHQSMIENELFMEEEKENPKAVEIAQKNIAISDRLMKNINEVLAIMKKDVYSVVSEKEEIDLLELYTETLQLYQPQLFEKELYVNFEADEIKIMANKASIQLLVHNLISNMVQYSKRKSELDIMVDYQNDTLVLRHQNESSKNNLERMKKSEQLFNVVQSEASGEHVYSSGNGLFLIKDLTELMHGVYQYSVEGNQVEICISLPVEIIL